MESWMFYLIGFVIWAIIKGISDDQKKKDKNPTSTSGSVTGNLEEMKQGFQQLAQPNQRQRLSTNQKPIGYFSNGKYFDNEAGFDTGSDYDVVAKDYDQTATDYDVNIKVSEDQFENHRLGDHPKVNHTKPTPLTIPNVVRKTQKKAFQTLRDPENARNALILSEILGQPKSRKR